MNRYVAPVAYVAQGNRSFWFVLWNGRRIYCHISNYSELQPPRIGDWLSFELGPGRRPELGEMAINIRPAKKEKLHVGADSLRAGGQ